jgi:hypothetical protein
VLHACWVSAAVCVPSCVFMLWWRLVHALFPRRGGEWGLAVAVCMGHCDAHGIVFGMHHLLVVAAFLGRLRGDSSSSAAPPL